MRSAAPNKRSGWKRRTLSWLSAAAVLCVVSCGSAKTVAEVHHAAGRPSLTPKAKPNAPAPVIPAIESGTLPWTLRAPISREALAPGTTAQQILIAGGLNGSGTASGVFSLNLQNGALQHVGDLPVATHDAGSATLGSGTFLFGGGASAVSQSVEETGLSGSAAAGTLPTPLWNRIKSELIEETISLPLGDPANFTTHIGAVIDQRAFTRITTALYDGVGDPHLTLHTGGTWDDSTGWFIFPTIFETDTPKHPLMETELFGPVLTVYTYEESAWDDILTLVDTTSPYGLTGAIFATDRAAIAQASDRLRHAAGNFYINDKPTGAVIGQQPFGGARASGTNDKAGSPWNLMRWASPRSIKETFVPPTDWRYPHLNYE